MHEETNALAGVPARRRWMVAGLATASVVAGIGLAWWRGRGPGLADGEQAGAQAFWAMEFDTPEGGRLAMASFQGGPVLLNFWATWCAPCIEEMPMLDAFHRDHAAKGWQVVGLAIDQPSAVRKFLERTRVTFPIGLAGFGGTDLSRQLGNMAGGLPYSVVFDRNGRVRQRRMGRVSEADLQAWAGLA